MSGLHGCLAMVTALSHPSPLQLEALLVLMDTFVSSIDVQSLQPSQRAVALQLLHQLLDTVSHAFLWQSSSLKGTSRKLERRSVESGRI